MKKFTKEFGHHYLVDFIDCDSEKIKFVRDVKPVFLKAARRSRATILESFFHQFEPYGVTGIIMIAESHFSIHTWPEDGFVAFDVLTCGEMSPQRAIEEIKRGFAAQRVEVKIFPRGFS